MASPLTSGEIARLLDEHGPALRLYASGWSRSPDDCVQMALIEIAGQVPPPSSPVAWLYHVVRQRARNEHRSSVRRTHYESHSVSRVAGDAELSYHEAIDLLEQLEPDDRELVVLRIWGRQTFAEIAEITGKSTSGLQRQYERALKLLRNVLEPPTSLDAKLPEDSHEPTTAKR